MPWSHWQMILVLKPVPNLYIYIYDVCARVCVMHVDVKLEYKFVCFCLSINLSITRNFTSRG